MSTHFTDIRAALDTQLATLSLETAYENVAYEPVEGTPYVLSTLLPAETVQIGLGTAGKDRHQGLYQIDTIFSSGDSAVFSLPDTVADGFKRGTDLLYNGTTVSIRTVSIETGRQEGGYFVVPVTVRYYATTTPRS